jgi:hypothetical protein
MAEHPVVASALREYPAQADRLTWARTAALEAEGRLATVRALPAEVTDGTYTEALRAAAISVTRAHQQYPGLESTKWMERSIQELERLAGARFGASQTIVFLGYSSMPMPAASGAPRSTFGL